MYQILPIATLGHSLAKAREKFNKTNVICVGEQVSNERQSETVRIGFAVTRLDFFASRLKCLLLQVTVKDDRERHDYEQHFDLAAMMFLPI